MRMKQCVNWQWCWYTFPDLHRGKNLTMQLFLCLERIWLWYSEWIGWCGLHKTRQSQWTIWIYFFFLSNRKSLSASVSIVCKPLWQTERVRYFADRSARISMCIRADRRIRKIDGKGSELYDRQMDCRSNGMWFQGCAGSKEAEKLAQKHQCLCKRHRRHIVFRDRWR